MPFLAPVAAWLAGGTFLANVVVGVGLSVASTLISNALRPKQPEQRDPGMSLTMKMGGNEPLSFLVGLSATAGHRVYAGTWGNVDKTPNAFFVDVLELANAPIDGLNGVFVDGERATILTGQPHAEFGFPIAQGRVGGKDHLWVKFHDGRQTTPDPYLRSRFGGHAERPYPADMVGRGTPYAIVTTLYNREHWQNGAPKMLFELRGMRFYDIRRDSTAGGSGAHRRNDPATWEYTQNPYVIAYNVAFMGVYVGNEWMWGLQNLPSFRLPASAWIAAMNEADRALSAWGGVPQFQIGGEIGVDMEPAAILEEIAKSSAGRMIETGGYYKPRCGAPGTSLWSFGEAHMLISEPRTFTPFPGLEQTHNTVEATYAEPAEAWGTKAAPAKTNAGYIAADDNRRLVAGLTFPMVSRNEQAQRLAYTYLEDGRRFRQLQAWFHPISWVFEPGDVIDGTILHEGYDGKAFEILEMSGRRSAEQRITLREIDPNDFDPPISSRQDWSVSPITVVPPPPQMMVGWQVEPAAIKDELGRDRRPSIRVSYSGDQDDVDQIEVSVRLEADQSLVFTGRLPYGPIADANGDPITVKSVILNGVFLPNTLYEVQGRFIPFSSRVTVPSLWLPVITPNILLGADDIYLPGMVEEISQRFGSVIQWTNENLRDTIDDARRLTQLVIDQDVSNYNDKQQIRKELASTFESARSEWKFDVTAATGDGSAIVQRLEELRAEVFDPDTGLPATAEAVNLLSTRVDTVEGGLASQASAILSLSTSYNEVSASANFRMEASAGPSGYAARIAAMVRTGGAGNYREGGWFVDVPPSLASPVMLGLIADWVVISASASPSAVKVQPFVFDGNTLRLGGGIRAQWANISQVIAENLQVTNAMIANATITNAKIANATILDGNIAANAITNSNNNSASNVNIGTGWANVTSTTVVGTGNPLMLYGFGTVTGFMGPDSPVTLRFRITVNGVITHPDVFAQSFAGTSSGGNRSYTAPGIFSIYDVGAGTHTVALQANAPTSGQPVASGQIRVTTNKR